MAFHDVVDRHLQLYNCAVSKHEIYVLVAASCAAACGNDRLLHILSREEHLSLDNAESPLPIAVEEDGYGGAIFLLDSTVSIEKLVSEKGCKLAAEGTFAAVAISD